MTNCTKTLVPLIESALEQGVDLMMIMCTNRKEYDRALALKKQYPENLKVAWGFFPEDAREITEEDLEELRKEAACGQYGCSGRNRPGLLLGHVV